jgi:di/tripeptidase
MEKLEILKEVLSLPSISGKENIVRDYIINFAKVNGINYSVDQKGNVYLTKGERDNEEFYPCVVSHIDTVHRSHINLIEENKRLVINESRFEIDDKTEEITLYATHPETNEKTGIGGDDKCGVFVCLEMFKNFDKLKGAFFVEEEIGMLGSKQSDDNFFVDVGYAIQFDAPSANWITEVCSGVRLFDTDFKDLIKPHLNECGYTQFSNDPFTDVNQLASKYDFCCLNLGCGYYSQHTNNEYVIVDEVFSSLDTGKNLIEKLGLKKYYHDKGKYVQLLNERVNHNQVIYYDDFDEYDGYDELDGYEEFFESFYSDCDDVQTLSESITDMVLTLSEYGYEESEISEQIRKLLKDKLGV